MQLSPCLIFDTKARLVLAFFFSIILLSGCLSQTEEPKSPEQSRATVYVTKVKDGDSLMLRDTKNNVFEARLFGIDAPELNQPYGKQAKLALSKLAYKKTFTVNVKDTDKYDRAVVILSDRDSNLNQTMLTQGHAWVYRQYQSNSDWIKLETSAKQAKRGLWKLPRPIAPWDWRHKGRKK